MTLPDPISRPRPEPPGRIMDVQLIVARALDHTIGDRGKLPWRLPKDLARFRELTMGHSLIMGRRTFESLPGMLEGRRHIVMSRSGFKHKGVVVVDDPYDAIHAARDKDGYGTAFVIGGAAIYSMFIDLVRCAHVTLVGLRPGGDRVWPYHFYEDEWDRGHRELYDDGGVICLYERYDRV